jgi:hypothetical protein
MDGGSTKPSAGNAIGAARLAHRRPVSTYNVLGRQPTPQRAQAQPSRHRRRALELLAGGRDGCTEAVMLVHGFTVGMMVELVNAGLASASTEITALRISKVQRKEASAVVPLSLQVPLRGWLELRLA